MGNLITHVVTSRFSQSVLCGKRSYKTTRFAKCFKHTVDIYFCGTIGMDLTNDDQSINIGTRTKEVSPSTKQPPHKKLHNTALTATDSDTASTPPRHPSKALKLDKNKEEPRLTLKKTRSTHPLPPISHNKTKWQNEHKVPQKPHPNGPPWIKANPRKINLQTNFNLLTKIDPLWRNLKKKRSPIKIYHRTLPQNCTFINWLPSTVKAIQHWVRHYWEYVTYITVSIVSTYHDPMKYQPHLLQILSDLQKVDPTFTILPFDSPSNLEPITSQEEITRDESSLPVNFLSLQYDTWFASIKATFKIRRFIQIRGFTLGVFPLKIQQKLFLVTNSLHAKICTNAGWISGTLSHHIN